MDTTNTNNLQNQASAVDTVAQDFRNSLFIVSLLVNLVVLTSWLAFSLA